MLQQAQHDAFFRYYQRITPCMTLRRTRFSSITAQRGGTHRLYATTGAVRSASAPRSTCPTTELFSFLRQFVQACNESNVFEGQELYLVGSFLTGAAANRFNKILPDTAGHIPGRTVASFPEAVHWLLVTYADSVTLNQAVSDVKSASLGAHEVPDAFAVRLRGMG